MNIAIGESELSLCRSPSVCQCDQPVEVSHHILLLFKQGSALAYPVKEPIRSSNILYRHILLSVHHLCLSWNIRPRLPHPALQLFKHPFTSSNALHGSLTSAMTSLSDQFSASRSSLSFFFALTCDFHFHLHSNPHYPHPEPLSRWPSFDRQTLPLQVQTIQETGRFLNNHAGQ